MTLWGRHAAEALSPGNQGRVLAVFERALYLEVLQPKHVAGRLACLGEPAIGAGPLNALLDRPLAQALPGMEAGTPFVVDVAGLRLAGPVIGLDGAERWRPQPWPTLPDPHVLARHLEVLPAHWPPLPAEGLAPLVLGQAPGVAAPEPGGVSLASARPALAALERWLADGWHRAGDVPPPPEAARMLLGLGPGLTPSGDDLLGGMLLALWALGDAGRRMRAALADWVLRAAPEATTPVSVAHLRAAAGVGTWVDSELRGEGAAVVHLAIQTLLDTGTPPHPAPWRALAGLGHTSGWDALAGAWLVLRGWCRGFEQRV